MIRVILEKVEEKLAQYHQDNKLVKAALCFCKCCFWCLEKFMKFLNRNAYIMCAVSGNNFCTSAKDAFFLLLRNAARLAVLTGVVNFLMFLSKIVVVGLCAALSYIVFSGTLQVRLYPWNVIGIVFERPRLRTCLMWRWRGCPCPCQASHLMLRSPSSTSRFCPH